MQLESRFATDAACRGVLARVRWPQLLGVRPYGELVDGARPMDVHGLRAPTLADRGDDLPGHRDPADAGVPRIWWVTSEKNGTSVLGLHASSGWASYRTARTWLHQLRRAMVRPGRERLSEVVEVDETFVDGIEAGRGKQHVGKKALVVVAAEVQGRAIGRIRPA
jgi:hypothetical protein